MIEGVLSVCSVPTRAVKMQCAPPPPPSALDSRTLLRDRVSCPVPGSLGPWLPGLRPGDSPELGTLSQPYSSCWAVGVWGRPVQATCSVPGLALGPAPMVLPKPQRTLRGAGGARWGWTPTTGWDQIQADPHLVLCQARDRKGLPLGPRAVKILFGTGTRAHSTVLLGPRTCPAPPLPVLGVQSPISPPHPYPPGVVDPSP